VANEIYIAAATGLVISLQLYSGASPVGSTFTATEISTTGEYVADFPIGVAYGRYLVLATVGADIKIASGEILWDGNYEVVDGIAKSLYLDPATPRTDTPTTISFGDVVVDLVGDPEVSVTATRQT